MTIAEPKSLTPAAARSLPRIGFAGVGWIGRHRMQALIDGGLCIPVAIAEPGAEAAAAALESAPEAERAKDFEELIARDDLDAVVIATPSAAHASQSIAALERGLAVFCQKPLGRNAAEVSAVIEAAKSADRLLGVDLSYRHTVAMQEIRKAIQGGMLGDIFSIDLVFHNAYGPDKPWFYDKALSGGGCVIDLGVHLVDLALWALDFPQVKSIESHLHAGGKPLTSSDQVEDHAIATITLSSGAVVRLACSWKLQAGHEAEIAARFYGTAGGLEMHNVNGSFYDFRARAMQGTASETLAEPPDQWGGRAIIDWAEKLAQSTAFRPEAENLIDVSKVLDGIYRDAIAG